MVNYMMNTKPKYQQIYVEITNICNLRCPFCLPTKRPTKQMSLTEVKEIAEKIKNYTHSVYLHVKGEPLMHRNLKEIIDIFKSYNIKVKITTNGIGINKHLDYLLNNDGINKINISLQSVHNMNMVDIRKYFTELSELLFNTTKTHIYLRNWALDLESKKILEDELKNIFPKAQLNDGELLKEFVHYSIAERFEWPTTDAIECEPSKCLGGKSQIGILSDGTVVLCCLDTDGDTNLGNIFESDLESIITSDKYKDAVNKMPYLELCKKCTYRLRFKK